MQGESFISPAIFRYEVFRMSLFTPDEIRFCVFHYIVWMPLFAFAGAFVAVVFCRFVRFLRGVL